MSARDELAATIEGALDRSHGIIAWAGPAQEDIADAILAAGYRKPRAITTAEELDALAEGVILRAEHGGVWTRAIDGIGAVWRCAGYRNHYRAEEIDLPATVLYEPATPGLTAHLEGTR